MNNDRFLGVAAIAGCAIAGVVLLPASLGFGTSGIVAGSIAAGIQSAIGNVAAGSTFAICTSLGMKGVFATTSKFATSIGILGITNLLAKFRSHR